MPLTSPKAQTEGSTTFDPDKYFEAWSREDITPPYDNDIRKFIIKTFGLQPNDDYIYRATAEITLLQAQTYTEMGAQGSLHAWYKEVEAETKTPPTATDIAAYADIFRPTTSTSKLLLSFASNAKKNSIRADVAKHLQSLYQPPTATTASSSSSSGGGPYKNLTISRSKDHVNPYFDIWAWSNQNLEWTGPEPKTAEVKFSHALLPILYHHFGCVCPSYEALSYIEQVASGRVVLDVGSGNGYWTYMLRRFKGSGGGGGGASGKKQIAVTAIDNGVSEWRTMWIGDTIHMDGAKWLAQNRGGAEAVLLLVYPSIGDDFVANTIKAYKGRTIICASTQNANGFTAFAKETIAEWMKREMPTWAKILQIPLPSFAGKDEALFIFEKTE